MRNCAGILADLAETVRGFEYGFTGPEQPFCAPSEDFKDVDVTEGHHGTRASKAHGDHEDGVGLGRCPITEAERLVGKKVVLAPANQRRQCKEK